MRFFPEEDHWRLIAVILYAIFGGILLYFGIRYLFSAFLPFLIAFFMALLLRKPTVYIAGKAKISRRLIASLLAVLSVSALLFGLGFGIWKLIGELGSFAMAVISGENPLLTDLQNFIGKLWELLEKLPFSHHESAEAFRETLTETVLDMAKNTAAALGTKIPEFAAALASAIPQVLIFGVVTVLSAVYFCADYDRFSAFLYRNLHGKAKLIVQKTVLTAKKTLLRVLRSYAVLFLFTFAELLLGFVLLKEPYAFLLALLTALVDSLPIFGTGTILVPMAIYRFLIGDIRAAIGLGILYGVVTVVRQILEPKILGEGFGMHPLFMLIAIYTGFRLFGVLGMILLPIIAVFTKNIYLSFKENKDGATHGS